MRPVIKIMILVMTITILFACKAFYEERYESAQDYYNQGRYDIATRYCLQSLNSNPEFQQAYPLLEQSYEKNMEQALAKVNRLYASKTNQNSVEIYNIFAECIKLNEEVNNARITLKKSMSELISKYEKILYKGFEEARNFAAEQYYQEGLQYASSKNTDDQKLAAKSFATAMKYIPGYKDAQVQFNQAKSNAIKRLAVIPFEDLTNKRGRYGNIPVIVVDNIINYLFNDPQANEYIELIAGTELENIFRELNINQYTLFDSRNSSKINKLTHINEIIIGKITQIIFSPEHTSEKSYTETANVILNYKVVGKDSNGKDKTEAVWGDVQTNVKLRKKIAGVQIHGSFQIIDIETGKIKKTGNCSGSQSFESEWATAHGDKRAISYKTAKLIDRGEQFSNEDEMVSKAANQLSQNLYNIIREYTK